MVLLIFTYHDYLDNGRLAIHFNDGGRGNFVVPDGTRCSGLVANMALMSDLFAYTDQPRGGALNQ